MTIFNNSHTDTEGLIFHFMDDRSLFILSGISRDSYQIINAFVKDRLFRQHPLIAEGKIQFNITCYCHPENCWKVLCFAYSSGVFPESNSLAEQAIPRISEFYRERQALLEGEKERLENALEFTCKSYDEAQMIINKLDPEYEMMNNKKKEFEESLKLFHSYDDMREIEVDYLEPNIELLLDMTNKQLENLFMDLSGNDGFLNRKLIQTYLSIINFQVEFPIEKQNELIEMIIRIEKVNQQLKEKEQILNMDLDKVNQKIKLIDLGSCNPEEIQKAASQHKQILTKEFESINELELALTTKIPILKECETIICSVLDGTRRSSPAVIAQIIELINSCPHYDKKGLKDFETFKEFNKSWEFPSLPYGIFTNSFLQDKYGCTTDGSSQPDQWTEEQFHRFLGRLEESVTAELVYWTERMTHALNKEPI